MTINVTNFDATNIPPQQMGDKHPEGTFPFQISNTFGRQNKNTPGGQFVVELQSPAGTIANNYNLWNESEKAREIAHKELSALCHAVGIFQLGFVGLDPKDYGRELRGARGTMKVGPQTTNPEYMEVKKIFDINGNEPGKAPAAAPATQGGGWNAAPASPAPAAAAAPSSGGGWGSPTPGNAAPATGGAAAPPWAR